MYNNKVELLAPAGNMDGFYGAIHAGADAIYLGGNRFGARAYADNFTTEELVSCIRYAHLWNRKVYLTVNTLVKENEFNDIYEYILPYYQAGLDGVIIQDIGVFAYIRDHFPGMELHVSTQMTLTGEFGAKLLKQMGACRIVPARELSLKEIRNIKNKTNLSIEAFIHGAMCYSYSGQCLFSSILGGRSGNRGRCAQPCRLPYQVEISGETSNKKEKRKANNDCYPLSLKDMCTIQFLPELIEAGIDSFKIEGRMKKPEYTAGVTSIYRKYIDQIYSEDFHQDSFKIQKEDLECLEHLYIRSEIQDGYYHKHNGKDMITLSSPAYSGSNEKLLLEIRKKYLEKKPKKGISIYANFTTGQVASLTILYENYNVTVYGNEVDRATNQPINEESIKKQLKKLGDSIFVPEYIEITVSNNAFYSLKAINELRRNAILQLENEIIQGFGFSLSRTNNRKELEQKSQFQHLVLSPMNKTVGELHVLVHQWHQLKAIDEFLLEGNYIKRIIIDISVLERSQKEVLQICNHHKNTEFVLAFPQILRENDWDFLEHHIFPFITSSQDNSSITCFSGVMIRSLEAMGMIHTLLEQKKFCGRIYTDFGFYIWNLNSIREWISKGIQIDEFCLPLELKGSEQFSFTHENIPCEKVVYGRAPMMFTANCVAKTTFHCLKNEKQPRINLIDRFQKRFPVELNCRQCMNTIYNSVPLSLHKEISKWNHQTNLRIDFTVETQEVTRGILQYFSIIRTSKKGETIPNPPFQEYTNGHEKRGVE